ncbi:hypothetical protein K501DRAFT_329566 [Backusella circina FSU 941]|nr:hypothetical protein K501DRAFT_329566 [Backusella circina FSU 941]
MKVLYTLIASTLVALVSAVKLEGDIAINSLIQDVQDINLATTRVVLNGAQHTAHINTKGHFEFPSIQPGSYLLEIQSIDYIFPKLRVDVSDDEKISATYTGLGIDWNQRGFSVDYPLQIQAKAEADYFMEHKTFNVMGMFKNPMFLMMGFSALMMLFMPRMLKSVQDMDPEAFKEISQNQADAQKTISDMTSLSQLFTKAQQQQSKR